MSFFISMAEAKKDVVKPVIVLDATMGSCGFHEHAIKDEHGKFGATEICVRDFAACPICKAHGDPTFVIKLSVLDLSPYTIEKGDRAGTVIPFTKKMMTIKSKSRAKFREIEQACIKQNGTFRGCYLELKRDKTDATSVGIGEPQQIPIEVTLEGGKTMTMYQSFDFVPEAFLLENYGSEEKRDTSGKIIKDKNSEITVYDYSAVFPEPNLDELNRRYGGGSGSSVGSSASVVKEWESGGKPAEAPQANAMTAARSRLRTPTQTAAPAVSEAEAFEQMPEGTPATGPVADAVVVEDDGDDEIPFGD